MATFGMEASGDNREVRFSVATGRRRPIPPPRLEWGGGRIGMGLNSGLAASNLSTSRSTTSARFHSSQKVGGVTSANGTKKGSLSPKKKRKTINFSRSDKNPSSALWVDKYAPTDTSSLCVAPKKAKEVREWLEESLARLISARKGGEQPRSHDSSGPAEKMLILVGSPGIGKSTLIRVLAAEMGWRVHEWNDAHHNAAAGIIPSGNDALLSLPYQSQLASFDEFLQSAGSGFGALALAGSSAAAQFDIAVSKSQEQKKQRLANSSNSCALVMIEETPNLHSTEACEKIRAIMSRHIHQSNIPTVMIFSDVCEGKHRPDDLERLIDASLLYSPLVQIKQIHPVTKSKMKKCLTGIVKAERLTSISDCLFEELHAASGGDLRHAIMALQFQHGVNRRGKERFRGSTRSDRDKRLSTFHALGKLLYAKRRPVVSSNTSSDARPPLEFLPEDVMNGSDIDRSGALSFLSYHSPDFFTDESELSAAFDHFSDAAVFLDRQFRRDHNDQIFPLQYVSSLAGRAVADANKHPAPNKFRQLNAPKIFEVMRKRRSNEVKMLQLCKRLSCGSHVLPQNANIGSSDGFVVDSLPFMRNILPHDVDHALSNLHSYAKQADDQARLKPMDELILSKLDEQNLVLEGDDIVDEDSCGESSENKNDLVGQFGFGVNGC